MEKDSFDWEIPMEQLGVYFLFSYFCGAVYDKEIRACVQLAVVHTWLLREMLTACWLRNEKNPVPGGAYRSGLPLLQRAGAFQ